MRSPCTESDGSVAAARLHRNAMASAHAPEVIDRRPPHTRRYAILNWEFQETLIPRKTMLRRRGKRTFSSGPLSTVIKPSEVISQSRTIREKRMWNSQGVWLRVKIRDRRNFWRKNRSRFLSVLSTQRVQCVSLIFRGIRHHEYFFRARDTLHPRRKSAWGVVFLSASLPKSYDRWRAYAI